MISQDYLQQHESNLSPRISFSSEFLDESNFISICPNPQAEREAAAEKARRAAVATRNAEFEFLSGNLTNNIMTADQLFYEGKLLPFWQLQHPEKHSKLEAAPPQEPDRSNHVDERRINWFVDDDPSPRPPKCTVLWKELLRLKKQRASSILSPSYSSSSSSSSFSSSRADHIPAEDERNKENSVKKAKKVRSFSIRIRPVLNVPVCTQAKNSSSLPPLYSLRKGRSER